MSPGGPCEMATRIAFFVAALALGTLVEYLLHRFFLHSRLRHGVIRRHKMHHKTYVRYSIASEFLGFFPPAIPFLWVGFVSSTAAGIAFIAGEVAFVRAVAARTCAGRRRAWRTRQLVRVSDAGIRGRPFGNRGRACRRSRRPILASPGDHAVSGAAGRGSWRADPGRTPEVFAANALTAVPQCGLLALNDPPAPAHPPEPRHAQRVPPTERPCSPSTNSIRSSARSR